MIKLNFKINDRYLVFHTLVNCDSSSFIPNQSKEDIVTFQNYAREQSEDGYNFLRFGIDAKSNILGNKSISDLGKKADELLNSLVNLPQYQKIKLQAKEALQKVKVEWE